MSKRNHPVDVAFFKRYAGFSYDPATETRMQGKLRCARALATAEAAARAAGCTFDWDCDPEITSADWVEKGDASRGYEEPWQTYACVMRDKGGRVVASLGGVDFGRDGSPRGEPYARVVEAELACEAGYPCPLSPFTVVGLRGEDGETVDWIDAANGDDAATKARNLRGGSGDWQCVAVFAGQHSEVRA